MRDLTVQNGFERHVDLHLKNEARAAGDALGAAGDRRALDLNIEVIRRAVREPVDPKARGLAVFSCAGRGFRQVVALEFPVEDRLVVDSEPYVLPILEHWFGDPLFLVALVDSDEAHLFEARHGHPDRVRDVVRDDTHEAIQRDKPRFTIKKRFAQTRHERLFGLEDDRFLKSAAEAVASHWKTHDFAGLILLGQPPVTSALKKLLPREVASAVTGEAPHAMRPAKGRRPDRDGVGQIVESGARPSPGAAAWGPRRLPRAGQGEAPGRRRRHRGPRRLAAGARHRDPPLSASRADIPARPLAQNCNYRLGAPVRTCPSCDGPTRPVNAVQDILRMAMRHRVPVHTLRPPSAKDDPLAFCNGVASLLRAEANWAPSHGAS